jgi:hypothetical protein
MKSEQVQTDITVIGGGLAGVCAAVAAARLGRTVSLVQNRPVLGGNSSSEVRVWVCGATAHGIHRYARETGIMGEMFVENQYRNIDGNPYFWDLVVLETVRAEKNIQLFLSTDVHEVEAEGTEDDRVIKSVTGWMMASERRIRFESKMYLDCTGDGLVGFLAGAKYRIGREARSEFNEPWAPEVADNITLGSTILFYTKDAGRPVKYIPPSFARDITKTSIPVKRVIKAGASGCSYWWIEWGGELDTVHDNERIRDELWAVIYGIWDYIKNSGKFPEAEKMTLEWVGSLPGKREYRRFIGDYILNQHDIMAQEPFPDRVAFGGWSIDLHPPQGVYSKESGSKHLHVDGCYHIPFRSLYSKNIRNMMFAGRDISATHVAFGTTRVMATCAVIGEGAGTGAALAVEKGVTPRELHNNHLADLSQTLLRQDASVIGLRNEDPRDLARKAKVGASSTLTRIEIDQPIADHPLTVDSAQIFPVDPQFSGIEVLVSSSEDTTLELELFDTGRPECYIPRKSVTVKKIGVPAGGKQWVKCDLDWKPESPRNAFLVFRTNPKISLHLSDKTIMGLLAFTRPPLPPNYIPEEGVPKEMPTARWKPKGLNRKNYCFRVLSPTSAFDSSKVIDGFVRPFGGPHLWISEPMKAGKEEWVELSWTNPRTIRSVHVTFNDDVQEDLVNLHLHRTPFEVFPELVKDYRIEAKVAGAWKVLHAEKSNRKRKRVHSLPGDVSTDALRCVIVTTNGHPCAQVIEIRIY